MTYDILKKFIVSDVWTSRFNIGSMKGSLVGDEIIYLTITFIKYMFANVQVTISMLPDAIP